MNTVENLVFSRGKYEETLTPGEFLRAADAPQEAEALEQELSNRLGLGIGTAVVGGIVTAAGLVVLTWGTLSDDVSGGTFLAAVLGGTVAAAAGGTAMVAGPVAAFSSPLPLDPPHMRQLADRHNEKIGCPDTAAP